MQSYSWASLVRYVLAVSLFSSACLAQMKPRIAVYPFDDRTTSNKDMNIGTKVCDLLISKLAANGAFAVHDRQYVDQLLKEKNIKYDPNFDSSTAAKSGLLGTVDVVVYGQVDAFNSNTKDSVTSKGIYKTVETDGSVSLKVTARILSVERGSILAAPTAKDDQNGVLNKVQTVNSGFKQMLHAGGLDTDQGSQTKNIDEGLRKLVDQAADEVTKQLTPQIAQSAETIKVAPPVEGKLTAKPDADAKSEAPSFVGVKSGLAYIDQGSDAGIKKGQKFTIRRSVDTGLKNKKGEPLFQDSIVCTLAVSTVNKNSAAGKCTPDPTAHGPDGVPLASDEVVAATEK